MKLDVMNLFGDSDFDFDCPECSRKITLKFKEACKEGATATCPSCDSTIILQQEDDNERKIKDMNKALGNFEKALKKFK